MTSSVSCRRPGNCPRPPSPAWLDRPGPTVLVATLRAEQRELLRGTEGELTREVRMVLDSATSIELGSTREDPAEQARAAAVYPQVGSRPEGLAEILAGAPELLRRYRDAATADPLLHTWSRPASTGRAADSRGPSRSRTCSPSPATPSRRTAPTSTCATTKWTRRSARPASQSRERVRSPCSAPTG